MADKILYNVLRDTSFGVLVNGNPLPPGVTVEDWMHLHYSPGFYHWLNAIHGCQNTDDSQYWRLSPSVGWCGV